VEWSPCYRLLGQTSGSNAGIYSIPDLDMPELEISHNEGTTLCDGTSPFKNYSVDWNWSPLQLKSSVWVGFNISLGSLDIREGHPVADTNTVPDVMLHLLDNAPTSLCKDHLDAPDDIFVMAILANSRAFLCGLEHLIKDNTVTPHIACAFVIFNLLFLVSDQHNVLLTFMAENLLSWMS
jgi:hypothetical protein